jgi:hypothetical protein
VLGVSELFIDRRVLIYAFGVSLATGATAGFAPAILFARRSMADALRTRGSKLGHAPRVRQGLVIVQVAMTVVLLCGAGVLVRTLIALDRAPTGFDPHDVLTMSVAVSPTRYTAERCREFYREAVTRVRALPGVESAAAGISLPVIGSPRGGTSFHELGTPERPSGERSTAVVVWSRPDTSTRFAFPCCVDESSRTRTTRIRWRDSSSTRRSPVPILQGAIRSPRRSLSG